MWNGIDSVASGKRVRLRRSASVPDGDVNGRCVEQAAISPQSVQEIQEGSGSSPNAKVTEKQCRFSVVFWNRVDARRIAPVFSAVNLSQS